MSSLFLFLLLTVNVALGKMQLHHRQECSEICDPDGATSQILPEVGPALTGLLDDLVATVNGENTGVENSSGPAEKRQEFKLTFCCALKNECYLLQNFNVPFCYDNWTTGFDFADGSYGSLVSGNYSSSSGTKLNLIYGDYDTPDGMTGNIYSAASTSPPDTTAMPMPTPWTSKGVGTAVPASELGSMTPVIVSDTGVSAITLLSSTIVSAGPIACTLCIGNHSIISGVTGLPPATTAFNATATATGNSSTSNASIIIPPITKSWAQSCSVAVRAYILIFLTAMIVLTNI